MGGSGCLDFSVSESGKLPDYGNGLQRLEAEAREKKKMMRLGGTDDLDAIYDHL